VGIRVDGSATIRYFSAARLAAACADLRLLTTSHMLLNHHPINLRMDYTKRVLRNALRTSVALLAWHVLGPATLCPAVEALPPGQPAETAPQDMVKEIRFLGNDTIPVSQIASHLGTRVGRPFDISVVQRDVRRLANLGWFIDVKPLYEETRQGRIVIFQVVERPTIRYVTYLGNDAVSDKKLSKETGLKAGGAVDPYAVEEARRKIEEYYHGRGHNHVQVTILEGTKATDHGISFLINEGTPQRIWNIKFEGNVFVGDGRLKTIIQSKPPILKVVKGYVEREKIEADVELLTSYYRSFGFFQAKVSRKIDYYDREKWVQVTYVIHEGPRYHIRNVQFIGNSKFDPVALADASKLKQGDAFEQTKMRQDAQWVQELYGSHGYVFADIRPEPVFLEEPGEVDLIYHIEEGEQFRVGRILVHIDGDNPHTRIQTALNRMTIRPGDIMDIRELKASERRLLASSLFHNDPASGIRPKITYRIPDDAEMGPIGGGGYSGSASASGGNRSQGNDVRGQSPDQHGPNVIAPPSYLRGESPGETPNTDIHIHFESLEHYHRWLEEEATASPQSEAVEESSQNLGTVIRGQSPQPGQIADIREIKASERRLLASSLFQNDHLPKAEFRTHFKSLEHYHRWLEEESTASPQSEPVEESSPSSGTVIRGQSPQASPQNAWWVRPQDNSKADTKAGANPYESIRGQNPTGQVNSAYSSLPTTGPPNPNQYGGTLVGATDPSGKPPATASTVYPAQYSESIPPPSGGFGPTPGFTANPVPGYQVFPDGRFGLPGQPYPDRTVDVIFDAQETQTGRLMLGVGVNSDAGVIGNIVLDERNFDWRRAPRSFEDIRNGTAFRGAGQRFRIDASPGSEINRYLASFQEPYLFDTPVSLGLSGSYFDRRFRDWDEQRLGGRISFGYQWVEYDLSTVLSYRGENVKISRVSNPLQPDLAEVIGDNALHGFKLTVINDTRDSAFLPTTGHYMELSGEQVVGTFDYPRVMADYRRYFLLRERPDHSGRHVLSAATNVGYTGSNTPIYEHFFAGGFSTLRGFDFRGASPVDMNVQVGGEFQWLNSVQYLFPITADDMLHGVVFCDFGTVEQKVEINDFRVAPGVGLRITVPAMGPAPIALDFAFPVAYADTDDKQVFSFSMGFSR